MILKAAAKINLMLDILGQTEDGYHTLFMIMQSVGLYDTVTLTETGKPGTTTLSCSNEALPSDETNIGWKAADAFFKATGVKNPGIHIDIEKHIPFAAGLAGGSADAAAVFVGLNELTGAGLSERELCQIAVKVGADVPFCIMGGTMAAMDIGEVLAPLPDIRQDWYVLVKPEQDVSTKEAYAAFDSADYVRHLDTTAMLRAAAAADTDKVYSMVSNVFEQFIYVAGRVDIKAIMREHDSIAHCMSGSGPTIYGVFETEENAKACAEALLAAGYQNTYICQPVKQGVTIVEGV